MRIMSKIRYRCCTCGAGFWTIEQAIEHQKAWREQDYMKHHCEPVEKCIMCPGQEDCLMKGEFCEHLFEEPLSKGKKEAYCGYLRLNQKFSECPFQERRCVVKIAADKFKIMIRWDANNDNKNH